MQSINAYFCIVDYIKNGVSPFGKTDGDTPWIVYFILILAYFPVVQALTSSTAVPKSVALVEPVIFTRTVSPM